MQPIVMCGIPRSGSTLVGQILKELFPERFKLQTHPSWTAWMPKGELIFITIRDPRDIVASLYRVRLSRSGEQEGTEEDLSQVLNRTLVYFHATRQLLEEDHVLLRYEDFVHDTDVIFNAIAEKMGIEIPVLERDRIASKFSVEANRARASKLKDFNEVDEDGIHGDHIGPVDPGSWLMTIPVNELARVREACRPVVEEWGYAH